MPEISRQIGFKFWMYFWENIGFANIIDDIKKAGTMSAGPKGAIYVYASTTSRDGHPGHAEIKMSAGNSSYASDPYVIPGRDQNWK